MGTSEGARKGWSEERKRKQSERWARYYADPENRKASSQRALKSWENADERRATQGAKVAAKLWRPPMVRWEESVDKTSSPEGCWTWLKALVHGYGKFSLTPNKQVSAMRWYWIETIGEIPEGYELDHLCHNRSDCPGGVCRHRSCVNPEHLEAVPPGENQRRRWERQRRLRGDA